MYNNNIITIHKNNCKVVYFVEILKGKNKIKYTLRNKILFIFLNNYILNNEFEKILNNNYIYTKNNEI